MLKFRSFLAAAILAVPAAALADTLSYNYVQGSYQIWTDPDTHVWSLRGSYRIVDNAYVMVEDDNLFGRAAGLGFIAPVQSNMHLYGELALGDNDDGFRPVLEGGLRMAVNNELELRGAVRFITDGAVDDDEILFIGEGAYHVNKNVAVVGGISIPVEADGLVLQIGGRFSF